MKPGTIREMVVDAYTGKMISVRDRDTGEWLYLEGNCLRCGKCCSGYDFSAIPHEPCEDLIVQNIDGKDVYSCRLEPSEKHSMKPWGCKLSPLPENVRSYCGYKWVKR